MSSSMQSLSYARVLYDFSPSAPGELAVKANDIILITELGMMVGGMRRLRGRMVPKRGE